MGFEGGSSGIDGSEIRQRLPLDPAIHRQASSSDAARETVLQLNQQEGSADKDENEKRTYGRTPDGRVFIVPQTHDMVSQLLSPTQPKNASDVVVLIILGSLLSLLYFLPRSVTRPLFAVYFLFWRAMYNGGIGWLLYQQSNYQRMVQWARKSKIFVKPSTGEQPRPILYKFIKREFETKIPKDYNLDEAPIEYNTWLLFRRFVDLVLLCDFICYCSFAIACGGRPTGEHLATTIGRWVAGIALFLFNLWVKLDAHRVVKDYAWYWGDFFYLIDQELTFDGVFEMAPHPMYSVGYAGFYGISLMAASYKVLFISIVGHAAQFAFLALVESPHIEKTYNSPPPRHRLSLSNVVDDPKDLSAPTDMDSSVENLSPVLAPTQNQPYVRDLIGVGHTDLHRVPHVAAVLLQVYLYAFALVTPSTMSYQAFFLVNAILWRLWYSIGIGYILDRQSNRKSWTRHFIKYGESTETAWRQWRGLYHISMTMCYASFITAAYKMYAMPSDWEYGMSSLRHILGAALIALQLWTVFSIYESLGEFGWFFGDFFFDHTPKLTYNGIYRFLNNPERVLGLAGVWGIALITWSKAIFFLALLSHMLTLAFIQFVERPHMEKRYGQSLRQSSGLSKSFKRSLPQPLRSWQGHADRVWEESVGLVEDFIDSARPKLAAGYETFVKDTKALFRQYPARLSITRLAPDIAGFDPMDYSLEIEGTPSTTPTDLDKRSGREGEIARTPTFVGDEMKALDLEYGAPIKVKWTAPATHSKRDWIGLYMIADNSSREVTRVSAQGRWIATNKAVFDAMSADVGNLTEDEPFLKQQGRSRQGCLSGEVEFSGDKLWWTTGVFEFRYHHNRKHNVMAISRPFEIRIGRIDDEDVANASDSMRSAVEQILLPLVRNCFDRDPEIAPNTFEERYGSLVERDGKFAKRVVFAVRQMFGIEFAPEVVRADGNVRNLAWRICNAKMVLAPYSMSLSRGTTTPTDVKD